MPLAVELSGLLGVFIVLVGAWGVLAPGRLTDLVLRFSSKAGLWTAAAIRLLLGFALWFAAPASRAPLLLQILGVVAIAAAVALPLLGIDRFKSLLGWWEGLASTHQRLWSLVAVAVGAAILWALLPAAS